MCVGIYDAETFGTRTILYLPCTSAVAVFCIMFMLLLLLLLMLMLMLMLLLLWWWLWSCIEAQLVEHPSHVSFVYVSGGLHPASNGQVEHVVAQSGE